MRNLLVAHLTTPPPWVRALSLIRRESGQLQPRTGAIASRDVSIDAAAAATGMSRRHLERLFLRDVGLPPKQLARIVRFQRALRLLDGDGDPPRGVRAAHGSGYADQAHFIRDFRAFAGCAPGEHVLRRAELTGFFSGAHDRQSR
jgi:AraC-like DNA-binding protein